MQQNDTHSTTSLPLDALEWGCVFLGSGGGGSTRTFREYLRHAVSDAPSIKVRSWTDGCRPAAFGIVGALEAMDEGPPSGEELRNAYAALCRATNFTYSSVIPWQVGGVCSLTAVAASLQLDLPLVDADLVGRAVSSLAQLAHFDALRPVTAGLSSPTGDTISIEARDCAHLENVVRQLLGRGCGWMAFAMSPSDGSFTKGDLVHGQLRLAHGIGSELLDTTFHAPGAGRLSNLDISILGSGRIAENTAYRLSEPGTRVAGSGSLNIRSFMLTDDDTGAVIRCDAASEFLLVLVDGLLAAAAPEIIVVQDVHTGSLLAPQDVRRGATVRILRRPYLHLGTHLDQANQRLNLTAYGLAEPGWTLPQ